MNWLIHRLVFAASIFFVISNGALLIASLSDTDDNSALTIISDVAVAALILISCVLVFSVNAHRLILGMLVFAHILLRQIHLRIILPRQLLCLAAVFLVFALTISRSNRPVFHRFCHVQAHLCCRQLAHRRGR